MHLRSLPLEGASWGLSLRPGLECKAPSESWSFLRFTLSSSTFFVCVLFFFLLNGPSASFLTCWKIFPRPKLGSGTLSPCERISPVTQFRLKKKKKRERERELFVLPTFVLGTFLMNFLPSLNLWIPRNIHTHIPPDFFFPTPLMEK